eukprot:520262-Pyramimonas_sp.AAC.1
MAIAIAHLKNRYPDILQVEISPASVAALSDGLGIHACTFTSNDACNSSLTFDPQELVTSRRRWQSTNPHSFEMNQSVLFN